MTNADRDGFFLRPWDSSAAPAPAAAPTPHPEPGPAADTPGDLDDARAGLYSTIADLPDHELRDLFPDTAVARRVEEAIDDIAPDLGRATLPAVEAALDLVAKGFTQCAHLKDLASIAAFERISSDIKAQLRSEKQRLTSIRSQLESRQATLKREAADWQRAGGRPTGFAAIGLTPADAAKAAADAEALRRLQRETDEYELRLQRETLAKRKESFDRQHEEFLRVIRGRAY